MSDDIVWLIEQAPIDTQPKWLIGGVMPSWTADAHKALRFATESAAREYIALDNSLHGICWPTEHMFMKDAGE